MNSFLNSSSKNKCFCPLCSKSFTELQCFMDKNVKSYVVVNFLIHPHFYYHVFYCFRIRFELLKSRMLLSDGTIVLGRRRRTWKTWKRRPVLRDTRVNLIPLIQEPYYSIIIAINVYESFSFLIIADFKPDFLYLNSSHPFCDTIYLCCVNRSKQNFREF